MNLDDLKREVTDKYVDHIDTLGDYGNSKLIHAVIDYLHAQGRIVPDGYTVLPKEPTLDNIDEGVEACWEKFTWAEEVDNSDLRDLCRKIYKAMIAAAQNGEMK